MNKIQSEKHIQIILDDIDGCSICRGTGRLLFSSSIDTIKCEGCNGSGRKFKGIHGGDPCVFCDLSFYEEGSDCLFEPTAIHQQTLILVSRDFLFELKTGIIEAICSEDGLDASDGSDLLSRLNTLLGLSVNDHTILEVADIK